jgi:hypothetical protein
MAINLNPKEKRTVEDNPSAGCSINDLDFPQRGQPAETFEALPAAYAIHGHPLHRTDTADGRVTFSAERRGHVRYLPTLHDVTLPLTRTGGRV